MGHHTLLLTRQGMPIYVCVYMYYIRCIYTYIYILAFTYTYIYIYLYTRQGRVFTCGSNDSGQLGLGSIIGMPGTEGNALWRPVFVKALRQFKVTAIAAGIKHSTYLTSDDQLFATGSKGPTVFYCIVYCVLFFCVVLCFVVVCCVLLCCVVLCCVVLCCVVLCCIVL